MRLLRALAVPCALLVAACADSPVGLDPPSDDALEAAETADLAGMAGVAAVLPPETIVKIPVYVRSPRWQDQDSVRVLAGDHRVDLYHSNAAMFTHDRMVLWRRSLSRGAPADTASRSRPAKGENGVWFEPWLPWFGLWWRHEIRNIDFEYTEMMHRSAGWYSLSDNPSELQVDTTAIGFRAHYYREEPRQFIVKLRRDGLWTEKVKMWTPVDSVRAGPVHGYVGTNWCRFNPVPEKTNAEGVTWETDVSCQGEPWEQEEPGGFR